MYSWFSIIIDLKFTLEESFRKSWFVPEITQFSFDANLDDLFRNTLFLLILDILSWIPLRDFDIWDRKDSHKVSRYDLPRPHHLVFHQLHRYSKLHASTFASWVYFNFFYIHVRTFSTCIKVVSCRRVDSHISRFHFANTLYVNWKELKSYDTWIISNFIIYNWRALQYPSWHWFFSFSSAKESQYTWAHEITINHRFIFT